MRVVVASLPARRRWRERPHSCGCWRRFALYPFHVSPVFSLKHDSQSPWGTNGDVIFPSWLDSLSGLGALVSCFAWFCHWLPSATRGCHVHRGTACTSARICEAAEPGAIRTADLGRLGCGLTVGVSRVWRSGMPDFVALPRCCLFVVAG